MTELLSIVAYILFLGFLGLVTIGFWAIGLVQFMEWIFS